MVITVRLFAMFREGRFNEKQMELSEGSSLNDLMELLKIPVKDPKVLLVNGISTSAKNKLNDGDIVAVFPMIAGG